EFVFSFSRDDSRHFGPVVEPDRFPKVVEADTRARLQDGCVQCPARQLRPDGGEAWPEVIPHALGGVADGASASEHRPPCLDVAALPRQLAYGRQRRPVRRGGSRWREVLRRGLPDSAAERAEEHRGGRWLQVRGKAPLANELQQLSLTRLRTPEGLNRRTPQRQRAVRREIGRASGRDRE